MSATRSNDVTDLGTSCDPLWTDVTEAAYLIAEMGNRGTLFASGGTD
jgi:hypothetical protein